MTCNVTSTIEGTTVNDVWEKAFDHLSLQAKEGHIQDSRDGEVVGELINTTFVVMDPTRNIVTSPIRKLPMRYAVGELAWYLSGTNKMEDIAQFAPKWEDLSDDGVTSNSAYGYRIKHMFGFDQWEYVKQLLIEHPDTRQAIIHIKDASNKPTKDVPCTVYLQFLLRDGELHLSVHMRSNDIWMGVPYDMFTFCFLQMKMAMEIGAKIRVYVHYAGSLHLYKRDFDKAMSHLAADNCKAV